MGLDMYLKGSRYLGFGQDETAKKVQDIFPELEGMTDSNGHPLVNHVQIEAGYWRKANQIHAWFVKNVQKGVDDCGDYHLTRDDLRQLRDTCTQVLADPTKAEELLPTQRGFFFGGTDYDEYYLADLENTITIIDRALSLHDQWDFLYHSSW
jgi:hypothetical protein